MEEKHQESTSGKVSMSLKNSSTSTLEVQDVTDPGHEEGFAVSPAAAEAVRRKSISIGPSKNGPSYWRRRTMVRPPVKGDPRERVSKLRKAAILAVVSQAGCLGGFSSTIYFPSLVQISKELNASQSAINVSVSLFILFMGIGPVLWATLSDGYKIRRILYLVSTAIFCAASIGGGYATSAGGLTAARVFQAIGSSGPAMLGPGSVADIYVPTEQGTAMGLMFLGQFLGPVLGPPIGGVLAQALGWQWTFWFMAIVAAAVMLQLFFIVPETYREEPKDVLAELDRKEQQQQHAEEEQDGDNKITFPNPLLPITLLRFPVIFLASLEVGMIFALMFSIETISPVLFDQTYHLNESQTGATYIAAGVGSVIGAVIGGRMSDMWLVRGQRKRGGGELVLEDRLSPNIWISAFLIVPLGALMYGWSAENHTTIALPIAGFGIYNFGMSQVMGAGSAYIVNAIPGQGSIATAASNFVRMVLACVFSMLVKTIVDRTSYGWYGVILAAINVITMGLFVIVKVHGAKMRADACRQLGL